MEFGMQFFPDVSPVQKSAQQYFDDCLRLAELCDPYCYTRIRTVEHYFHPYGGYSPNPLLFLTAASQRSQKARLVTGAVLPIFNNPLKVAGEIGMLDGICGGRLEIGFARAFLPHEFASFGIPLNESVARFDEGTEQIRQLLEGENVTCKGEFYSFKNITSLPRPTQKPRPRFWTAAISTPASFEKAGRLGNWIMGIPLQASKMTEFIKIYREAWKEAGHPGQGRVMLAFHMFCHEDAKEAVRLARDPLNRYLKSLLEAASGWTSGASSADYPGYAKLFEALSKETFESQVETGAAWVGTPDDLIARIGAYNEEVGGFEDASMQVNYNTISYEDAAHSVRLFGEAVMPAFAEEEATVAD